MTTPKCAVIIPTKNAMPGFASVLDKVRAQKAPWPFETIVIDSGSRDGTCAHVQQFDDVRLIQIDPKDFGHGRTRNQGVAETEAEFVAFLTHDAEPVDEDWLANMVAAAEQDPRIAGVFGRHVADQTASPFTRRDLDLHFQGFLAHPLIVHRDLDPEKYETDIGWQQFLHFYSDNNSLMRRSVWTEIPYPDVEFAEDQIWARTIIEAGYAKAYAPEAAVIHSHDYRTFEQLRRAFDESRNFRKYFGYRLGGSLIAALVSMFKAFREALVQPIDAARYGKVSFAHRLARGTRRMALIAGHFLGTHHAKLPVFVQRRLSLDQRLFDS